MYYPKSQIVTNQYTNGDAYAFDTSPYKPYTGYYYVISTGEIFSGRNPNDGVPQKLVPLIIKEYNDGSENQDSVNISYLANEYDNIRLKTKNIQTPSSLLEPKYTKPTPSYPSFTRYFVKKTNELRYIEVNKATYDKIVGKDLQYNWAAYQPFTIYWKTSGASKQEVEKTNKGIVALAEKNQKLYGLSNYFKNYSEFFA